MAHAPGADKSGALFDHIKKKRKFTLDGQLAEFIGANRSEVSAIRHGKREVSPVLLVRICEKTGLSLKAAKAMIDDKQLAKEGA